MFDANARYLDKGTLFFASRSGDLLLCEMLEQESENPRIQIITSYQNIKGSVYTWVRCGDPLSVFEGYLDDGVLRSFICPKEKQRARVILDRVGGYV